MTGVICLMENYTQVTLSVDNEQQDLVIGMLMGLSYDSFAQFEGYIEAYILTESFEESTVKEVLEQLQLDSTIQSVPMEQKNWNEEWEKNFEPMVVEEQCYVRASFHPERNNYPYEVIINPKMSFGTGHHATTYMMMHWLLELDVTDKKVIDAGCGTGILSILAEKKGAHSVIAFDIEDWAFENLNENCNLNGCNRIETGQGSIADIVSHGTQVDILLANINKNVLLDEMGRYAQHLLSGGTLLLSGFYEADEADITQAAKAVGLEPKGKKVRLQWMSLQFVKAVE